MTTTIAPKATTTRPAPNAIEAYIEQLLDELFAEETAAARHEPVTVSLAEYSMGDYLKYMDGEA
ncbi:MAG: hypothetical protein K6V36_04180 [Anaerolineae bacterium]|jgi:flagellar motor switch protein FliG|nr:hypothetical protein [Anaerolineae bacterium]